MNLDGVSVKPAEGKVAVRFVDDEEDGKPSPSAIVPGSPESMSHEGVLAIVAGVGTKVTGIKKGDTVVMRAWARDCPRVGSLVFCDAYDVLGTIVD